MKAHGFLIGFLALGGCDSTRHSEAKSDTKGASRAVTLPDLSASLDAVRAEFNAHKQEARFLTLLAPT